MRKGWTEEQLSTAITLLQEGKTYKEIGNLISKTPEAVKEYLRMRGYSYSQYYIPKLKIIDCKNCLKEFKQSNIITPSNKFLTPLSEIHPTNRLAYGPSYKSGK